MNAAEVVARIEAASLRFHDERSLQAALECGPLAGFERERSLHGAVGVVDFYRDGLAVEVKVAGAVGPILRQVQRYARSPEVERILVVTSLFRHVAAFPGDVVFHDVPVEIVRVGGVSL